MSAPAFAWALERGAALGLCPAERLVLIYLADMANGERVCWPGQPRIVRFTGLALRTVIATLKKLEARQLIRAETTVGRVTRYHILRDHTHADSPGVTPANGSVGAHPTPANGSVEPLDDLHPHPCKSDGGPLDDLHPTPANRPDDPSITQVKTQDAREAREGKVLDSGKEEDGTPPSAHQPVTSNGSNAHRPPGQPPDRFNDWLDGGAPADGPMHCATDAEEVTEDDTPQTKPDLERMAAQVEALAHELGQSKRRFAIPPGPQFTRWEQAEIVAPKRQWKQTTPEQLQAMYRAQGLRRGIP